MVFKKKSIYYKYYLLVEYEGYASFLLIFLTVASTLYNLRRTEFHNRNFF